MLYLKLLKLPTDDVTNPNIYPYNVLREKRGDYMIFDRITILYGSNGRGKSTLLNLIAAHFNMAGYEHTKHFYWDTYLNNIGFEMAENDTGSPLFPANTRYIKSEDILYEIKKIQSAAILEESYHYQRRQLGINKD